MRAAELRAPLARTLLWTAALALVVAALVPFREVLDRAHVALVLTLLVLGGSSGGGRLPGVVLAFASFLAFNWFFVPPYGTFHVAAPLDWLVLVVFLVTGLVAAQLLYSTRERARAALELSRKVDEDRVKNELLASLSHDLRTPLTTIKALAHDLGVLGDERSEIIEQEADRLTRTVSDLLDLSRLNAGVMPLRVELNAVDDLLGALVQRMEPLLGAHRLDVRLAVADPIMVGSFDFVHTLRILANLVENAAKYSPAHAPVEVVAAREGPHLFVSVLDRGPGLPAQDAGRVFEEYYRAPSVAPDVPGVGLGLAIAHRLAVAQGGELTWRAREGGGSAFVLRLPAADASELSSRA